MTQKELIDLLELLQSAYPNWKVSDPQLMLDVWSLSLGEYEAEKIYKSARYHIKTSVFPPSVAELVKGINKGQLLYNSDQTVKIEAPKMDIRERLCKGSCICPYFDSICNGSPEEQEVCQL